MSGARRALLYATLLPALLLLTAGVSLSALGAWVHIGGRWLWREHDKYLRWFHDRLCGAACPHWSEEE
ncbi:MAG TPA: hypothetical protein VMZ50_08320 [Phycisphaerae bacterium]|nr:hypothetical protein [Phycisphaerae bacterium]